MTISCSDYYNFLITCFSLHSCFSIVYYPPSSEIGYVDLVDPSLTTPPINYQLVSHTIFTNILNLTHKTLSWSQSWHNNKVMFHHSSTCAQRLWTHCCICTKYFSLRYPRGPFSHPGVSSMPALQRDFLSQTFLPKKKKRQKNVILPSLTWLCLNSCWNSTPVYSISITFLIIGFYQFQLLGCK